MPHLRILGEGKGKAALQLESESKLRQRSEYFELLDRYEDHENFKNRIKRQSGRKINIFRIPNFTDWLTAKRVIELLSSLMDDQIIWRALWVLVFFAGVEETIQLLNFLLCDSIVTQLTLMGLEKGSGGRYLVGSVLTFEGGVTSSGWSVLRILSQRFRINPKHLFEQIQSVQTGLVSTHKLQRFIRSCMRASNFESTFDTLDCRICLEKVHLKILTNWSVVGGALMVCCGAPVHRLCFWTRVDMVGYCSFCKTELDPESGEIDDNGEDGDKPWFRRREKRFAYQIPGWVKLKPPPRFDLDHVQNRTLNYPDLPLRAYERQEEI